MNTSVIRYRVADFFKRFAPFDTLPHEDLLELAGTGRVKFHEADEYVFWQGRPRGAQLWMVQQGRVELIDARTGAEELRDLAGEGDIIGLDSFQADGTYAYSARTSTDVLLYSFDLTAFDALAARHPLVARFRDAHRSLSGSGGGLRSWLDAPAPPLDFLQSRGHPVEASAPLADHDTRAAVRVMIQERCEAVTMPVHPPCVLTASDLALFCDRNPAVLLREIRRARQVAVLRPLLEQARRMVGDALAHAGDVDDSALLATEFAAAATEAAIQLAAADAVAAGLRPSQAAHCWIAFGPQARGELLRLTHPLTGVVFDDGDPEAAAYFTAVAGRLHDYFLASGLEVARDAWPMGCHSAMPFHAWDDFFTHTIRNPLSCDLFARREFFDLRLLGGAGSIYHALANRIARELKEQNILVPLLANDTLANLPPLTFFRGLVVDAEGHESSELDLSKIVLAPVSDAARVFALGSGCTNTLDRLQFAALQRPAHAELFEQAAGAFRIALFHQTRGGGPKILVSTLSRFDQRLFKNAFTSIARLLELLTTVFLEAK